MQAVIDIAQPRMIDIARAVELVDSIQGVIRGYHFIWGSPNGETGVGRDSYGTWFDKARPPDYSARGSLVGYPICIEHGQDPAVGKGAVAVVIRNYFDDVGLAFEAQLDKSHPAYARTLDKVRRGEYKTSSSSADHVADFYEDGAFRTWIHTETSLVENPSQAEMPAVSLIRSTGAEDERDARRASQSEQYRMEDRNMNPVTPPAAPAENTRTVEEELAAMVQAYGLDAVKAALDAMSASPDMPAPDMAMTSGRAADFIKSLRANLDAQKREQDNKRLAERLEALEKANQAADNAPPPAEQRTVTRGAPTQVEDRKFWRLHNASEAMFAYEVMRSQKIKPSADFMNALARRVESELDKQEFFDHPSFRAAMPYTRSSEIATSTASTGGDEWVGIGYSGRLWEAAHSNPHYEELVRRGMFVEEVPQGEESVYIPLEGADPTVYSISQPADLDTDDSRPAVNVGITRIGTDRVLFAPGELGMAVAWTDVFDEDSIIRVASQYNRQMERKATETTFQLFLNGDTATSGNINYDGGTPGTGLSTPYYISGNGAIKYALVTASTYSRSAGALDEGDYKATLALLPDAVQESLDNLLYFIDIATHNASLDIPAIKTDDVRRTNATITSGVLSNIWGIDVFRTGFMLKADTDGKITYNAAGTTGRILLVNPTYWGAAWKRQVTIKSAEDILSGTNIVVAKWRVGFMPRGAGAAALSYNVSL